MAGGQRIDDYKGLPHDSDMLMKSKNHVKHFRSADGAGAENEFEDTTAAIERTQDAGASKAKTHPLKSGYRN